MFRRRKKNKIIDEKRASEIVQGKLTDYLRQEDLKKYLEGIEKDKEKKEKWDSLSTAKKIKVLRYALAKKKGGQHGKK